MKAGLRPFNPDRVVYTIQKPLTEDIPQKGKVKAELRSQNEVLQTPVTAEALTSLRSLIEQDTHMLDELSKRRLQKLVNAAQNSLLLDENRLLFEQNNESNCRRSTRSIILGKAKVMSYEDIVEAQAKLDAKNASVAKGKPGRKRKSSAAAAVQVKRTRKSELEVVEQEIEAEDFEELLFCFPNLIQIGFDRELAQSFAGCHCTIQSLTCCRVLRAIVYAL